jgi:hypothetical protein
MTDKRKSLRVTAVFIDIRDFTKNLNERFDDDNYFELLESVYKEGIDLAIEINQNDAFYINSTGDGYLTVFSGEDNHLKGFFFALFLHKLLESKFLSYFKKPLADGEYFYGVGLESGSVKRVIAESNAKKIETYIGNVITDISGLISTG